MVRVTVFGWLPTHPIQLPTIFINPSQQRLSLKIWVFNWGYHLCGHHGVKNEYKNAYP